MDVRAWHLICGPSWAQAADMSSCTSYPRSLSASRTASRRAYATSSFSSLSHHASADAAAVSICVGSEEAVIAVNCAMNSAASGCANCARRASTARSLARATSCSWCFRFKSVISTETELTSPRLTQLGYLFSCSWALLSIRSQLSPGAPGSEIGKRGVEPDQVRIVRNVLFLPFDQCGRIIAVRAKCRVD